MIFVDTSALIAVIVQEPEARAFADRIEADGAGFTSVHVMLEATMRLSTMLNVEPSETAETVARWVERAKLTVMSIDSTAFRYAVDAFARYGKGRHPARLNFADCLSYACARAAGATLLYKGNDFARTDMG